jgi:hypothetical protein
MFKPLSKVVMNTSLIAVLCCINPLGMWGCNPPSFVPDPGVEVVEEDGVEYLEDEELGHVHRMVQLEQGVLEFDLTLTPHTTAMATHQPNHQSGLIASAHARSPDPPPSPLNKMLALDGVLDLSWTPTGASNPILLLEREPVSGHFHMQYRIVKNGFSGYKKNGEMYPVSIVLGRVESDPSSTFLLSLNLRAAIQSNPDDAYPEPPTAEPPVSPEDNPLSRLPASPVHPSWSLIYTEGERDVFVYSDFQTDAADEGGHWSKPRSPRESEISIP